MPKALMSNQLNPIYVYLSNEECERTGFSSYAYEEEYDFFCMYDGCFFE